MNNATWVPRSIIELVQAYENYAEDQPRWPTFGREYEIWKRLITRPEMEAVWGFLVKTVGEDSLTKNFGFAGAINKAIRQFSEGAKLSPSGYKKEMIEIAKLSQKLSIKLNKFCSSDSIYNPFPLHSLLSDEQLKESARRSKAPYRDGSERSLYHRRIDTRLPLLDYLLDGLSSRAKDEAENQGSRLKLPRKVNDKNLFRTYFIQAVGKYVFDMCADYSPTRIATLCSVALEDAGINADLVAKVFPLDEESKEMLAEQKSFNSTQED